MAHEGEPQWWRTRTIPDLVDVHTDVLLLPPMRVEKITLESPPASKAVLFPAILGGMKLFASLIRHVVQDS